MFEYTICNVYDADIFQKQCSALEKHISGLIVKKFLEDVDGTQIQLYEKDHKKLKIINDKMVGVFIESEFDIEGFFC